MLIIHVERLIVKLSMCLYSAAYKRVKSYNALLGIKCTQTLLRTRRPRVWLPCWLADRWHNQWLSAIEAHSKDCCAGPNSRYNVFGWYKVSGGGFESRKLSFVPLADFESNCSAGRGSSRR